MLSLPEGERLLPVSPFLPYCSMELREDYLCHSHMDGLIEKALRTPLGEIPLAKEGNKVV